MRDHAAPLVPDQIGTQAPAGLHEPYAAFYKAATGSGDFIEYPKGGPWGQQDKTRDIDRRTGQLHKDGRRLRGDRSVCLIGAPGTEQADVVIWLVDRDEYRFHDPDGDPIGRQHDTNIWFDHGRHSPGGSLSEVYDLDQILQLRRTCAGCDTVVADAQELQQAGFGGHYCPSCHPGAVAQLETPGWYN